MNDPGEANRNWVKHEVIEPLIMGGILFGLCLLIAIGNFIVERVSGLN